MYLQIALGEKALYYLVHSIIYIYMKHCIGLIPTKALHSH